MKNIRNFNVFSKITFSVMKSNKNPKREPKGTEMESKWHQKLSKSRPWAPQKAPMALQRSKEIPKWSHESPQWSANGTKNQKRVPKGVTILLQNRLRFATFRKWVPKAAKVGPKGGPDPQNDSKMMPQGPKMGAPRPPKLLPASSAFLRGSLSRNTAELP